MTRISRYHWLEIAVSAPLGDALDLLQHDFSSDLPVRRRIRMRAGDGRPWELELDGTVREFSGPLERAEWAYGQVHNALLEEAAAQGWYRLHAALIAIRGRAVLVSGTSGSGKTGLAIRLARLGAHIHSDEGVFMKDRRVMGLPRRLHVKDSARSGLDGSLFERAVRLGYTPPVWAVDPAVHWETPTLQPVPLSAIVTLGDRDEPLGLHPADNWAVLSELLTESIPFTSSPGGLLASLTALIDAAPCFRLEGHDGDAGAELLHEVL